MQKMKLSILASVIIISLALVGVGVGTGAFFSDKEVSVGNVFTAGEINISIDPSNGQDVVTYQGTLDLKPCQTGWTTTRITNVGPNPAELWKHIANVENDENGVTDAEDKYYAANPDSDGYLLSNWIHYDLHAFKSIGYSFSGTVGVQPVNIDVVDGDCQITWTIDYPGEAPYDETTEGNGHWTVGLIIAMNGDGNDPAYQVHNNDGTDSSYPWGTWLVSPYYDGAWHSGDENTPVSDLDWISCTGDRYNADNPDGIFTITINKWSLPDNIHWALNLAIGSGFWSTYMTYEQMSYPQGTTPWFDWSNPIVYMSIPNYEAAHIYMGMSGISEEEGFYLTGENGVECNWIYLGMLNPGETMCVYQSYHLDIDVDNWGQSDRVFFDMEFYAQQIEGYPQLPPPGPELPGHGRDG